MHSICMYQIYHVVKNIYIYTYIYIYVLFIFNYVLKYQIYSCIYILGVDGLNSNDNHQQKGWDMIGYKWVYIYVYIDK